MISPPGILILVASIVEVLYAAGSVHDGTFRRLRFADPIRELATPLGPIMAKEAVPLGNVATVERTWVPI